MAALLRPARVLLGPPGPARCSSSFVSRTRLVDRLKRDEDACAAALREGRVLLFHRLSPLLRRRPAGTFGPLFLPSSDVRLVLEGSGSDGSLLEESVLIGCSEQNRAQFCLDVGELDRAAVADGAGGTFMDLRKAFFLLAEAESPLVAKAQALLRWHQISRFCSATGQPTERNRAGSQRFCRGSSITYYPQMSPVVIVLVSDGKRCLLGRQSSFPRGLYSALAGFCDMGESGPARPGPAHALDPVPAAGETLEEALRREVAEEVGLEVQRVSYSASQHWPFPRSSFMVGCHATVGPAHHQLDPDRSELEDARWFTAQEVRSALQVEAPPRSGDPPALWLPPKHAIANRLIREWADGRRSGEDAG